MENISTDKLTEVSKANPCPHCGKPDWCYSLGELTVCKRSPEPATGWYKTTKQDSEGSYYYALISEKKPTRPKATRYWEYPSRSGNKLVRVCRTDDGNGKRYYKQQQWNGQDWIDGLEGIKRADIPIYNYKQVRKAIEDDELIFICEGEPCADALINLGFTATTNIGGSKKWIGSDSLDLGQASVCLVPDRDRPGIEHMEIISQHFPDAKWLYPYPDSLTWQRLPESGGLDVADWIADFNLKASDIISAVTEKKQTVTGDSSKNGDSSKPDSVSHADTVTTVTMILREAHPDWQEQQKLDELEAKTEMSKKAFWQLVSSIKCDLEEIQPEDNKLFEQLINWHDTKLDMQAILPHLGADILHDAKVLNIDPVAILHPLLPAVLSLLSNKVCLDVESHEEPPLLYSCLVGESGTGKTRGQKLIFSPLEKLQAKEKKRFDSEMADYKKAIDSGQQSEKPYAQRKYLFKVSTIQAVVKRLSEQAHGSVWSRDEIAGLFKSLDQFGNGTGEALEMLLELWNSGVVQVDRVSEDDSFLAKDTCLSIYGGIQPGKFSEIFKDPNDANGLQARFLFAVINVQPAKRVKGYCQLSEKLPGLYDWINKWVGPGVRCKLKLSEAADKRYTRAYEQIGEQAEKSSLPAIRGWMRKLPAQILRTAIALHAIDCYFEQGRPRNEIQLDTLNRAIDLCRYYRNSFALVQEKASDSDNPASILWKIWDEAVKRPSGLLCRDAYRIVKAIQRRAREVGRSVGAYTLDLFKQLEKQGWGSIERGGENKRAIRFVAIAKPPTEPPQPPSPPTEPPQPPSPPTEPPQPSTEPEDDRLMVESTAALAESIDSLEVARMQLPILEATDEFFKRKVWELVSPEQRVRLQEWIQVIKSESIKKSSEPPPQPTTPPKFKVGDTVRSQATDRLGTVEKILDWQLDTVPLPDWKSEQRWRRPYEVRFFDTGKIGKPFEENLFLVRQLTLEDIKPEPPVENTIATEERDLIGRTLQKWADSVGENYKKIEAAFTPTEKPKATGLDPGCLVRPKKGRGYAARVIENRISYLVVNYCDGSSKECQLGNCDVVPFAKFLESLKKGIGKMQLRALKHPDHGFYKKSTKNQGTLEAIAEKNGKYWARIATKSGLEVFNLEAVEILPSEER